MPIKKKQSARLRLWLDGWSLYLHSFPSTCKARLAAIFCCWLPNHRPLCGPKFWGWWRASPTCKYVFKMTFSITNISRIDRSIKTHTLEQTQPLTQFPDWFTNSIYTHVSIYLALHCRSFSGMFSRTRHIRGSSGGSGLQSFVLMAWSCAVWWNDVQNDQELYIFTNT